MIVGLTRYVNKAHLARAALEATCYQTLDVIGAMRQDAEIELGNFKVDGGMVVNDLLMQFQADILATAVIRPKIIETTVLGAAYAAGLAIGFWAGPDELRCNWRADRTWQPQIDQPTRQRLHAGWLKAIERSLDWAQ